MTYQTAYLTLILILRMVMIYHLTYLDNDVGEIQSCLNEDLQNKQMADRKQTQSEFMLIAYRQKLNTLTASPALINNGSPITRYSTTKSLGVLIVTKLYWSGHMDMLAQKLPLVLQPFNSIQFNFISS